MLYISTNAVFDGESAPYGETDRVNPVNAYGRIKLACERLVQDTLERAVVIRPISCMDGRTRWAARIP